MANLQDNSLPHPPSSESSGSELEGSQVTKKARKSQLRWTPYRDLLLLRQVMATICSHRCDLFIQVAACLQFTAKHGQAESEWAQTIAPLVTMNEFVAGLKWENARSVKV